MKKIKRPQLNSWSRYHPFNPILRSKEELEKAEITDEWSIEEFLEDTQPTITYSDTNCKVGDLIEDLQRNIKVALNKYECQHCGEIFKSHSEAMDHVFEFNEKSKHLKLSREDIKEKQYIVKIPRARIFYEVTRPEESVPIPPSVEVKSPTIWVDGRDLGKFEAQKAPTGKEREKYDKEISEWRQKMHSRNPIFPNERLPFPQIYEERKRVSSIQSTQGQRKPQLVLLPNGDIQEKGAGGRWWYYCPQILKDGIWCPACPADVPNWANFEKTRVLFLLGIIKETDEIELEESD